MSKLVEHFHLPLLEGQSTLRYNIAPTQEIAAVRITPDSGQRELAMLKWGLVPAWADDPKTGAHWINARCETAAEKPAFRSAFRQRRCLVPADGFFEWRTEGKRKLPHYITLADGGLFAMAGLWERWHREGQTIESCTILTTDANDLVRPLHDRMPVILPPEFYDHWLDPRVHDPEELKSLLRCFPAERMAVLPVDPAVNSPANDDPRCIQSLRQKGLFE
jgi:putative SOS response-associated peptidase YedK